MYSEILGTRMTLSLQRSMLPQLVWNQEFYGRRILNHVKPGFRWLDLGCGKRLLCGGLEELEEKLSHFSFVGLDPSFESLRAQKYGVPCVQGVAEQLPFKSGYFDLITSNMVIEHLQSPHVVFQELNRVLAPNGVILLHTPNLANYLVIGNYIASKLIPKRLHAAFVGLSDERREGEIYPTFYRANTVHRLRKSVGQSLAFTVEFLPAPRPFFHYFVPVALLELLLTRLSLSDPLRRFGTTMLITIRKADSSCEHSFASVTEIKTPVHPVHGSAA